MSPNKLKHVFMQCPNCKHEYERAPTLIRDENGRPVFDTLTGKLKIGSELPTRCRKCGSKLIRRVTRIRAKVNHD